MKFGRDIAIDFNILSKSPQGVILEIEFRGIHNHSWPHGKEIYDYLEEVVDKHKPDAILFNFLQYQYTFGNELMGTILIPICNFKQKSIRPGVIVADGPTKNSIQSLIDESMIQKVFNIVVLSNKVEALEHVKRLFSPIVYSSDR